MKMMPSMGGTHRLHQDQYSFIDMNRHEEKLFSHACISCTSDGELIYECFE